MEWRIVSNLIKLNLIGLGVVIISRDSASVFCRRFSHVSETSNQQHQLQVLQLGTKGLAFLERSPSVAEPLTLESRRWNATWRPIFSAMSCFAEMRVTMMAVEMASSKDGICATDHLQLTAIYRSGPSNWEIML